MPTFDPKDVSVIAGGLPIVGFAPGSFVSITYDEDSFSLQVGADGAAVRSKSNNKSATINITLMHGAIANQILSGFRVADEAANAGIFPLLITELGTGTVHSAEAAWVQKPPDIDYQTEAQPIPWVLRTASMDQNVGFAASLP